MDGRFVSRGLVVSAILGVVCMNGAAVGHAQSVAVGVRAKSVMLATISVDMVNAPLVAVLKAIAGQAGLRTSWDDQVVYAAPPVSLHVHNVSVETAFGKALSGTGLQAVISVDRVSFFKESAAQAVAQGSIEGKIVDSKTHQGLRGAIVTLSGIEKRITSSDDGSFRFAGVVPGSYTIHVGMLGYVKATKTIAITEGRAESIEVMMEPSVNALDQVVVTGTIVPTAQRAVPNAMTVITAKEIEQRGITHIDQLFRGDVPGLFALNQGSSTNALLGQVFMFSRGATALSSSVSDGTRNGTNPIKTYVDGVEMADATYLSQLDPSSIERIEILTGPQASTIYGSNALNGIIQIFTKRGAHTRPQLTAHIGSGFVQNNSSSALAPNHVADTRLTGIENRWSYNVGGVENYLGSWTPGMQTAVLGVDGGGRLDLGFLSTDLSARDGWTSTKQRGSPTQTLTDLEATGVRQWNGGGLIFPQRNTLRGQTFGLTLSYQPVSWWSHELVMGDDGEDTEIRRLSPAYSYIGDSLLVLLQNTNARTSQRYTTTARVSWASLMQTTVTVGADHWRSRQTSLSYLGKMLSGALTDPTVSVDPPSKNTGGFVQVQLATWDALYLTYGLRAEWNPNYGSAAQPNLAPRYGIAYTREWNAVTVKLRASWGRSTRPPAQALKDSVIGPYPEYYGPYLQQRASSDLGPETQQGGEGGVELYLGGRGSLVLTRYNQTVDGLIVSVRVDSADELPVWKQAYGDADWEYPVYIQQYLNVASIRNQGWELQGTLNTGPLSTKGTYSWTKSRVLGMTPRYQTAVPDYVRAIYQRGQTFNYLPEHTWAVTTAYSSAGTMMSVTLHGIGQLFNNGDALSYSVGDPSQYRSQNYLLRMDLPVTYRPLEEGYITVDFNASHRLSSHVESLLQVQNAANYYRNDYDGRNAATGRQSNIGLRINL